MRFTNTNRSVNHYLIRMWGDIRVTSVARELLAFGSRVSGKHNAMSLNFNMLTRHALSGFKDDVIDRDKYVIFYEGIVDCIQWVAHSLMERASRPDSLKKMSDVFLVVGSLGPEKISGRANWGRYKSPPIRTWGDYAKALRNVLASSDMVPLRDRITLFKMVMLLKDMRSEFSAPEEVLRQRQSILATRFLEFLYTDAANDEYRVFMRPGGGLVEILQVPQAAEVVVEPQVPQAAEVVVEPQVPQAAGVVEEPQVPHVPQAAQAAGVVEEPEFRVDEDGDVIMETEEIASGGRGSRRRHSTVFSYETEMSRAARAKRRFNLRDTRARTEWMTNLKQASDSKRKTDEEDDSPIEDSRKRKK